MVEDDEGANDDQEYEDYSEPSNFGGGKTEFTQPSGQTSGEAVAEVEEDKQPEPYAELEKTIETARAEAANNPERQEKLLGVLKRQKDEIEQTESRHRGRIGQFVDKLKNNPQFSKKNLIRTMILTFALGGGLGTAIGIYMAARDAMKEQQAKMMALESQNSKLRKQQEEQEQPVSQNAEGSQTQTRDPGDSPFSEDIQYVPADDGGSGDGPVFPAAPTPEPSADQSENAVSKPESTVIKLPENMPELPQEEQTISPEQITQIFQDTDDYRALRSYLLRLQRQEWQGIEGDSGHYNVDQLLAIVDKIPKWIETFGKQYTNDEELDEYLRLSGVTRGSAEAPFRECVKNCIKSAWKYEIRKALEEEPLTEKVEDNNTSIERFIFNPAGGVRRWEDMASRLGYSPKVVRWLFQDSPISSDYREQFIDLVKAKDKEFTSHQQADSVALREFLRLHGGDVPGDDEKPLQVAVGG